MSVHIIHTLIFFFEVFIHTLILVCVFNTTTVYKIIFEKTFKELKQ